MKGIMFLRSYYDTAKMLPDAERLALYDAILAYALEGVDVDETTPLIVRVAFSSIRPNLESSIRRSNVNSYNGSNGGAPIGNQNRKQANSTELQANSTEFKPEKEEEREKEVEVEKEKNPRRPKPPRNAHGSYQNVMLTDDQLSAFQREQPADWSRYVEELSGYIASTGKKYADHLATLRNWAKRDRKPTGSHAPLAPQTDLDHLF